MPCGGILGQYLLRAAKSTAQDCGRESMAGGPLLVDHTLPKNPAKCQRGSRGQWSGTRFSPGAWFHRGPPTPV